MRVTIECTPEEQIVFKRTLKSLDEKMLVTFRIPDDKPDDMTCGEYVVGMVKWEVVDES
jgi:hypothetical protein